MNGGVEMDIKGVDLAHERRWRNGNKSASVTMMQRQDTPADVSVYSFWRVKLLMVNNLEFRVSLAWKEPLWYIYIYIYLYIYIYIYI